MGLDVASLRALAERHGQGHIFRWWDELDETERARLLAQVAETDFPLLGRLIAEHVVGAQRACQLGELVPAEPIPLPVTQEQHEARRRAAAIGEAGIRAGQVAALVVAGGLGTRLGYDASKGTYPAAPITGKSLFQLHAEKIHAASRRYGATIPWYIMTSEANDAATQAYFADHAYFGLSPEDVVFFLQASMPVVGLDRKLLLAEKGRIATSPNGHGGTLRALRETGALDDMRRRGVRAISYFQVDNVLIKIIDPVFLGYHVERDSDFSSKALSKRDPEEGLGAFCYVDGKLRVVEYSDLPERYKYARRPDGSLVFSAGSIAVHALSIALVERITAGGASLPYHRVVKRVPCIGEEGRLAHPSEPNGVKFEMFIFDALIEAQNPVVMMVERWEEFAPIKNPQGEDSPAAARQAQLNLFGRWIERAGVAVPRDAAGDVEAALEISPLYALDADELCKRLPRGTRLSGELNLQA